MVQHHKFKKGAIPLCMILFSCILSTFSCKIPNSPVDAKLKAAYFFQKGTYWIYKELITGVTDSFYVSSVDIKYNVKGQPFHRQHTRDVITVNITGVKLDSNNTIKKGEMFIRLIENQFLLGVRMNYSDSTDTRIENDYDAITFPITKYTSQEDTVSQPTDYNFSGQLYKNVSRVVMHSHVNYPYHDTFYISPDIFLLKLQINDSILSVHRDYELQRYNIVK